MSAQGVVDVDWQDTVVRSEYIVAAPAVEDKPFRLEHVLKGVACIDHPAVGVQRDLVICGG